MQALTRTYALLIVCAILAGCQIGGSQGVLPRTEVPPPPSLSSTSEAASRKAVARSAPSGTQAPVAPDAKERAASEPAIEPVMTGRGMGAGFRF